MLIFTLTSCMFVINEMKIGNENAMQSSSTVCAALTERFIVV